MRSVKAFLTAMLLILTAALLPLAPALAEDSAADEDDGGIMPLAIYGNCRYCGELLSGSTVESGFREPTCTESGGSWIKCKSCNGLKNVSSSPALGHDWTETSRKAATCTVAGSATFICSRCDETKTETIPALGGSHTWTETSRTDATCTAAGSVLSTCSRCNETKTETIPVLDHDWLETNRVPVTCTAAGSVEYICSVCHAQKSEPLQPLGHAWTETGRVGPSCSPGSVEYTCSNCHEVRTETVPAITDEHTYEIAEVVPAVYDPDGHLVTASYIVYRCAYCGDSYNATVGGSAIGPIIDEGAGGDGMQDATAALGKTFLSGIWALFGIYVPGFSFTFGQMWLGVLLASISVLVVRMMFGFGGGSRGESTRTSSTNHPRIAKERRYDEF